MNSSGAVSPATRATREQRAGDEAARGGRQDDPQHGRQRATPSASAPSLSASGTSASTSWAERATIGSMMIASAKAPAQPLCGGRRRAGRRRRCRSRSSGTPLRMSSAKRTTRGEAGPRELGGVDADEDPDAESPSRSRARRGSTVPTIALAMPPPRCPNGTSLWVRKSRLIAPMPLIDHGDDHDREHDDRREQRRAWRGISIVRFSARRRRRRGSPASRRVGGDPGRGAHGRIQRQSRAAIAPASPAVRRTVSAPDDQPRDDVRDQREHQQDRRQVGQRGDLEVLVAPWYSEAMRLASVSPGCEQGGVDAGGVADHERDRDRLAERAARARGCIAPTMPERA